MSGLKPPKPFEPGKNPAEAWEKWRQSIEIYWVAADIDGKPLNKQKAILLHIMGEEALNVYNTFEFEIETNENGQQQEVDDVLTVELILDAFSNHYIPFKNETYLRHIFFSTKQTEEQSIDDFVTELKTKARDCGFGNLTDSLIRDKIVSGIRCDRVRQKLLKTRNLDLPLCISICQSEEETTKQLSQMTNNSSEVNLVKHKKYGQKQKTGRKSDGSSGVNNRKKTCSRCTYEHEFDKCPAMSQRCSKCKRLNHYAKACKSKQVHAVNRENEGPDEEEIIDISAMRKNRQMKR